MTCKLKEREGEMRDHFDQYRNDFDRIYLHRSKKGNAMFIIIYYCDILLFSKVSKRI